MRRELTSFDMTCIGVNAIVGSGIYLFPGRLASSLGPASTLAFALTGALCVPLALCFSALGKGEERSGGPYRYARRAFGEWPAFVVGWSAWVTAVVSWAAVANAVPSYLGHFVPSAGQGLGAKAIVSAVIVLLGALNYRGAKPGARLTDLMTVGKLLPLVAFVVLGAVFIEPSHWTPFAPSGLHALPAAALVVMFAYQGFEVVGVPAGEVRNPTRAVPRAVLGSLAIATVLYVLVQGVFVGVGGGSGTAPLADAASQFLGAPGGNLVAAGALVSILGFNAGSALCTPRYLSSLAEDRLVPAMLGRAHPRFGTPALSVVASTLITLFAALALDFDSLVDFAVIAVLGQYLASAAALAWLGPTRTRRLLGVVSVIISLGFASQATLGQLVVVIVLVAIGLPIAIWTRRRQPGPGREP